MIHKFDGEYRWLSNFAPVSILYEDMVYMSVESAYQAAKTIVRSERLKFRYMTAGQAKRAGKEVTLRQDWVGVKVQIMGELLVMKFQNPEYLNLLIGSSPHKLIEGNTWGDRFWGVYEGKGRNVLGELIMQIRRLAINDRAEEIINAKSHWDVIGGYATEDWIDEVCNGETRLGYKEWAINEIENAENEVELSAL